MSAEAARMPVGQIDSGRLEPAPPGYRDILVLAEGRPDDAGTIEYSARLASEFGAHLTGAFPFPSFPAEGPAAFAIGSAVRNALQVYYGEVALQEVAAQTLFERVASAAGLAAEWRTLRAPLTEEFATHSRYSDLTVLSRRRPIEGATRLSLAHSVVFASGRPVILLPPTPPRTIARRVLVGWNASREATRAVSDALPFLVRAEAVQVLIVDPDPSFAGHGPEPGVDLARHLARHDVRVDVRVVDSGSAKTGSTLLTRASAFRADLIVMGAYGHSRLTEFVFGGVTRTALYEADLPVFLSR